MTIEKDVKTDTQPVDKTLTKAQLVEMLKRYPDTTEVRVIINEQDIRKAELLRDVNAMPYEFELSKLYIKSDDDLKINAWVHVSRLPSTNIPPHEMMATNEYESEKTDQEAFQGYMQGFVKWFNPEKGIGFIRAEGIWRDIFVHYKDIENDGFKTMEADEPVSFSLYMTSRGPRAKQVRLIEGYDDDFDDDYIE